MAALMTWACVISLSVGDTVNKDGVLYIEAARGYLDDGIRTAAKVYGWPGYSILIAEISRYTGLSLESGAYLINVILLLWIADSFLRLYFTLRSDQDPASYWLPPLILLGYPPLGDRLEIIRDWGFLAFSLWAIFHLVRYRCAAANDIRDALLWQLGVAGALLFRIEALVLALFVPLIFLWKRASWRTRMQGWFFSMSWVLPMLLGFLVLLLTGKLPPGKLTEIADYGYYDPALVWKSFGQHAERIAAAMPNRFGAEYAKLILGTGLLATLLWLLAANLGPLLLAITGYGVHRFGLRHPPRFATIFWVAALASGTLLVFLAVQLVPVARYALLPSTLLLLSTARYAEHIFADRKERPWVNRLCLLFLAALLLDSLVVTADYRAYLREVGGWVRENIPATAHLVANDPRIEFYAGRRMNPDRIQKLDELPQVLQRDDRPEFLALRLTKPQEIAQVDRWMGQAPVAEFRSGPRERVRIYRLTSDSP
jgi:hypothetical protein